jgi:CubicO group peptidase (beta-lactamase class C family)
MKMFALVLLAWVLVAAEPGKERVSQIVEEARKAFGVPGAAVAVVRDGQIVYQEGHGIREAGKPESLTIHSTFQIASTTKAFTTAAMAMLVDEGKMQWDDPVRKHVDYFRLKDAQADALVTLRDIVSHRTGLPRHDVLWVRTGFDRESLIRRMAYAKPTEPIRTKYQYQNIMFTTAGEAVGKTSGLGWDRFMQQRIFEPLGMKDSSTLYAEMIGKTDRAMPHLKRDGKAVPSQWGNYDNIGGAGCISSSVADMTEWLRMQMALGEYNGKRLVSAKNLQETHLPNMFNRLTEAQRELQPEFTQTTYGMGWSINHYRGEMLVMHAGVLSGFRALVTMAPGRRLGFVVLANLNSTQMPEALTNALLDEYLELPKTRDWNAHMLTAVKKSEEKEALEKREKIAARKKDTRPSLELAAYVGTYEEPAYGEVRVALKDGKLQIEWARFSGAMEHWHFDTFQAKGQAALSEAMVTFTLNAQGKVERLQLLDQDFVKKP